uniref:Uncharacterized protein n=1 Tax=Arundo donax TaxID=35708 RepID=A0A0A9A3V1_ARUDO
MELSQTVNNQVTATLTAEQDNFSNT